MLAADGFAEAFIGVAYRANDTELAVYSLPLAVDLLVRRDGMTREEATEYIEFNCMGAWVGEQTPLWLSPMTMNEYMEVLTTAGKVINGEYYSTEEESDS